MLRHLKGEKEKRERESGRDKEKKRGERKLSERER
jgi:hypothetical protein